MYAESILKLFRISGAAIGDRTAFLAWLAKNNTPSSPYYRDVVRVSARIDYLAATRNMGG